jgi:hypothetical protein
MLLHVNLHRKYGPNFLHGGGCHEVNFSSQKQTSRGSLVPLDSAFPSSIHLCFAYD